MANTACTVKKIRLVTISNGTKYEGGIDMNGNERSDVQLVTEFKLPDQRTYFCTNCNKAWDGSQSFHEVKKHLGTFPID